MDVIIGLREWQKFTREIRIDADEWVERLSKSLIERAGIRLKSLGSM